MMGKYFSRSRTATRVSAEIPIGPAAAIVSGAMAVCPFAHGCGCGLGGRAQLSQIHVLVRFVEDATREVAVAEIDDGRRLGRTVGPRVPATGRKRAARRQAQEIRWLAVDGDEPGAIFFVQPRKRLEQAPRIRVLRTLED